MKSRILTTASFMTSKIKSIIRASVKVKVIGSNSWVSSSKAEMSEKREGFVNIRAFVL